MNHKRSIMLVALVVILLTFAVSGTIAWIATKAGPVENVFTPGQVDTAIIETFTDGAVKSDIKVLNKDDPKNVDVYVRVSVSGYYQDANGKIVDEWNPSFTCNAAKGWFKGSDGFYYYKNILKVGDSTPDLLAEGQTIFPTTADGKTLVVNVVHQSIQAEPTSAVIGAWGVNVATNGTISK